MNDIDLSKYIGKRVRIKVANGDFIEAFVSVHTPDLYNISETLFYKDGTFYKEWGLHYSIVSIVEIKSEIEVEE